MITDAGEKMGYMKGKLGDYMILRVSWGIIIR